MTSAWQARVSLGNGLYLMGRDGRLAPLYVLSFRLGKVRKASEAQRYSCKYEDLHTVPERLRWCRYRLGMMQKDVAWRVGIPLSQYEEMERGSCQEYPAQAMDKLAEVYGVPVEDLLDEYSRFLYDGPGDRIRRARERLGLSRKALAKLIGTGEKSIRDWEAGRKKVSKKSWEKLKDYLSPFYSERDVL